jgi:hypothetical protein
MAAAVERARKRAQALRKSVVFDQRYKLEEPLRQELLDCELGRRAFNKQKGPEIEWAMHTHNPLTGCRHDCPYCYARGIAENKMRRDLPEVYPDGFAPTLHPEALRTPRHVRPPKEAEQDHRYKNVLLCSIGLSVPGYLQRPR